MATQTPPKRPNAAQTLAEAHARDDTGRAHARQAAVAAVKTAVAVLEGDELADFREQVLGVIDGTDHEDAGEDQ